MKKLIAISAFLLFGTIFITAQTTKDSTKKVYKKTTVRKEMKSKTSIDQSKQKMVDTANLEKRQKEADEKLQKQTIPQKDGLNNEATKPAQAQPVPGQLE